MPGCFSQCPVVQVVRQLYVQYVLGKLKYTSLFYFNKIGFDSHEQICVCVCVCACIRGGAPAGAPGIPPVDKAAHHRPLLTPGTVVEAE